MSTSSSSNMSPSPTRDGVPLFDSAPRSATTPFSRSYSQYSSPSTKSVSMPSDPLSIYMLGAPDHPSYSIVSLPLSMVKMVIVPASALSTTQHQSAVSLDQALS